jgi:hypothetical protein
VFVSHFSKYRVRVQEFSAVQGLAGFSISAFPTEPIAPLLGQGFVNNRIVGALAFAGRLGGGEVLPQGRTITI